MDIFDLPFEVIDWSRLKVETGADDTEPVVVFVPEEVTPE